MYNGSLVVDEWSEKCQTILNGQNWAIINKLKGNNENNNMEIGKKELFKIVLRKTEIKDYTHEVMAKDKEEALEIIKSGENMYTSNLVSVETEEVK